MSSASAALPQPGRTKAFLRLVMIEHSVFALPFAYIAALTAMWQQTRSVHWVDLLLITVAMVSARYRRYSPTPSSAPSTAMVTRVTVSTATNSLRRIGSLSRRRKGAISSAARRA